MTTFYCFPTKQDYIDAITVDTVTIDSDGAEVIESVQKPPINVDVVGVMFERTGGTDEEPVFSEVPGYHVNTIEPVEGWELHQVFPSSPSRIFWGS